MTRNVGHKVRLEKKIHSIPTFTTPHHTKNKRRKWESIVRNNLTEVHQHTWALTRPPPRCSAPKCPNRFPTYSISIKKFTRPSNSSIRQEPNQRSYRSETDLITNIHSWLHKNIQKPHIIISTIRSNTAFEYNFRKGRKNLGIAINASARNTRKIQPKFDKAHC